ncbi:MAG: hypothetical protein Q7R47_05120 [Candidatus Diapherotrites archaeon]|nr:hypothetical protein [Candidatus Diapherotrites archaeon]
MWFDFRTLNKHSHFAAVVVTVQRMNALTARKADHVYLETYLDKCPTHDVSFESERFCPQCKFKWPAQNYVTNAGGAEASNEFWLDGWRSQDGEIRQFVFTDIKAGLGVAQQVIGDERTQDIRFAIFLSKEPKPISPRLDVLRRNGTGDIFVGGQLKSGLIGGVTHNDKGIGNTKGSDVFRGHHPVMSAVAPAHRRGMSASIGFDERGDAALDEFDRMNEGGVSSMAVIGTPTKQEVSFGRAVDQDVHPDPHDIDFWQAEPAAVIMLTPAPADWVATVTRNGATIDRTKGGMGPLAELKGVS